MEHLDLVGLARQQTVDFHRLGLTNPMSAGLRLQVVMGVPVRIIDNDRVSSRQIQAQPACAGRKKHDESMEGRVVEPHDGSRAFSSLLGPIQTLVRMACVAHIVLDEIEHADHLREDEHLVAWVGGWVGGWVDG